MIYLANPSTPDVRAAMAAGRLGMIATPHQGNRLVEGARWAADNGCFAERWTPDHWSSWLERLAPAIDRCLFAVVPDVVGDADATRERWAAWSPVVHELGYPACYVLQNGEHDRGVPWDQARAVFVGGDTEWKLGPEARALVSSAKRRGLWVHMGRVNSGRRLRYAAGIGCDSVDGTWLAFGPDVNLPLLERKLRVAVQPRLDIGRCS